MHGWVERLDAAFKNLWKTGKVAYLTHRDASLCECPCGPSGRQDLYSETGQALGEFNNSGLVPDTD
jgi:hypothetical protein